MKILITGKQGQLARCIADKAKDHSSITVDFTACSGTDVFMDLEDEASIRTSVQTIKPDCIINAAAYTVVDRAEEEPEKAMQINGVAPGVLAEEADKLGIPIIQVSTDYVFDGEADRAYVETDTVNPLGVYGETKLAGERAVQKATPNYIILRTAWVYSPYGKNFHSTMQALGQNRSEISVVDDQVGNPTSAHDIADTLLTLCSRLNRREDGLMGEVFHFSGPNEMTWFEFACDILKDAAGPDGKGVKILPISTEDYLTPAERPKNSRLNRHKISSFL